MNTTKSRSALLILAAAACATYLANAATAPAALALAPGSPVTVQTPPPTSATATPGPVGNVLRYSGRLLDVRGGFVFFTTGDGFRLAPGAPAVDAKTGGATKLLAQTGTYARATFDASGTVVQLALSQTRLPDEASYESVHGFAVALSTPFPNPDLAGGGEGANGKDVLVTLNVQVPPNTPLTDDVYVGTDTSGWDATAIKLIRVDALHYRITRRLASGTKFFYRYDRGSWQSSERGENGLNVPPRRFIVRNADVQSKNDVVVHWGDENGGGPNINSGTLPTPFTGQPFGGATNATQPGQFNVPSVGAPGVLGPGVRVPTHP